MAGGFGVGCMEVGREPLDSYWANISRVLTGETRPATIHFNITHIHFTVYTTSKKAAKASDIFTISINRSGHGTEKIKMTSDHVSC